MTETTNTSQAEATEDTDLVAAIRQALQASSEPLTLPKIRSRLPAGLRRSNLEVLSQILQRQAAAGVVVQYPKYRSQQERFWDRPMPVHIAQLLRETLFERSLTISELRRKLPDYAKSQAETVLLQEVASGSLYRHPLAGGRGGPRYGLSAPNPKDFLRTELAALFQRLAELGFTHAELRYGALELLHEEEWAPTPIPAEQSTTGLDESPQVRRDPAHPTSVQPPHDSALTEQP